MFGPLLGVVMFERTFDCEPSLVKARTSPVDRMTPLSPGTTPGEMESPSENIADESVSPVYEAPVTVTPSPKIVLAMFIADANRL